MRTMQILSSTLALLLAATTAGAQEDERLEVGLSLFPMHFDNFFQAPDGAPQEDVDATRVDGRLSYRLHPERPLRLTAEAGYTFYGQGLDDSPHAGVGLASEAGPREWTADVVWRGDQPVFDVGNDFEQADVLAAAADYGYRLGDDWEVHGLGEWTRQEYETVRSRDNDLWGLGAAVRYRGWGYLFSPEIGVLTGARDVEDPSEDHDQQDVWLKVRSIPVRPLYLSLRYRVRTRDYDTRDPRARNFSREDDRDQWTLSAAYRISSRLAANLYLDVLDADSTTPSRVFETTLIGLGLSWDL